MRAKWMIMGIALCGMNNAMAQGKKGDRNPCARMVKQSQWITDSLGLTQNQIIALKAIDDNACAELKVVRDANGDKESSKEKVQAIFEKRKTAIETLLTNEQKEKLKAHRKDRRMGKGEKKEKDPLIIADKMTKKMTENLALTSDQVPKVQEANLDFVTKKRGLKAGKDSQVNRKELKTDVENLRKDYDTKMKAILTTEQYTKWKELQRKKQEEMRKKRKAKKGKQ